jgi:hypothetical protein
MKISSFPTFKFMKALKNRKEFSNFKLKNLFETKWKWNKRIIEKYCHWNSESSKNYFSSEREKSRYKIYRYSKNYLKKVRFGANLISFPKVEEWRYKVSRASAILLGMTMRFDYCWSLPKYCGNLSHIFIETKQDFYGVQKNRIMHSFPRCMIHSFAHHED